MEIQFRINNQTLNRVGGNRPANKSQDFLKLTFDFLTTDWNGLTRFALFSYQDIKYRVPLTNDACIVPNAVLQGGMFSFSIYGVNDDSVRATTNRLTVYLSDSGYTTDVENDIPDDDPTIVEQIYLDMATAKTEAKTYAKDYTDTGLALKINISDIVDDTETSIATKPLSANMGKLLGDNIESLDESLRSVTIVKQATADTGYFSTYYLEKDGNQIGSKINIPKDYLLKSASLKQCTVQDQPIEGLNVGDWYFDWVLNTKDDTGIDSHLYLNANVLTDVYDGDNATIVLNDGIFSVKQNVFADKTHTHTKSDITDFNHTHEIQDITDFTNYMEEYTEKLLTRVNIDSDTNYVKTGDTLTIRAFHLNNGVPKPNQVIEFYKEE